MQTGVEDLPLWLLLFRPSPEGHCGQSALYPRSYRYTPVSQREDWGLGRG